MSSKCIVLTVVFGLLVVGGIVLNFMQSNDTTTGQEKLEDQLKNVQTAFDDSTKDEYSETLEEAENVWVGRKGPGREQAHAPVGSIVSRLQSGGSTEKSASMPEYGFHEYPLSVRSDITSPETDSTDASASVANEQINASPFLVQSNQDGSGGTLSSQNLISPHILADLESIESDKLHDYSVFCDVLIYDSLGRPVYDHTNVPLNSKGDTDVYTC
eukprot:969280_1